MRWPGIVRKEKSGSLGVMISREVGMKELLAYWNCGLGWVNSRCQLGSLSHHVREDLGLVYSQMRCSPAQGSRVWGFISLNQFSPLLRTFVLESA